MSENTELHSKLIDKQSTEELDRKRDIACRKKQKIWTQEDLDAAKRYANEVMEVLKKAQDGNDY